MPQRRPEHFTARCVRVVTIHLAPILQEKYAMDRRPPSRQSPDHPRHVGSKAKNGHEQQYDNSSRPANQAEAREPEMQMNMRKTMAPASSQGKTKKFPPEADETFGVVLEKDVAAWREKLNATYGIGDGRLVVIEDPAAG